MKTKPGMSPESIAFRERIAAKKAGLIVDEPVVIEPTPKPRKVKATAGLTQVCKGCGDPCDESDRDKGGNYRCRTCAVKYLDECRVAAIEFNRKQKERDRDRDAANAVDRH